MISELLFKNKIDRQNQKYESDNVVQAESLCFEEHNGENGEHCQRHNLLNNFQFDKTERSAVDVGPNTVGRNLKTVLKQRNAPTDEDYGPQPQIFEASHLAEFQVAVPRESHKCVRDNKQQNCDYRFHYQLFL